MTSKFGQQWQSAAEQWRTNVRLRWMLRAIGLIVLFYIALLLQQWGAEQREKLQKLQRDQAVIASLQEQSEWPDRLAHEQSVASQLAQRFWTAANPGLAEADVQNYLSRVLRTHNADQIRIKLGNTRQIDGLWQVQAEVNAAMLNEDINTLLVELSQSEKHISLVRFNYSPMRGGQLAMLVSVYFLPGEAKP